MIPYAPAPLRWRSFTSYEEAFLAFVAAALDGRLLLPLSLPRTQLYRESFTQLGALLARGVLAFLCRRGGWRLRSWVQGEGAGSGRIWHHPAWREVELRFDEPTLRAWAAAFEAVARKPFEPRVATGVAELASALDAIGATPAGAALSLHLLARVLASVDALTPARDALLRCDPLAPLSLAAAAGLGDDEARARLEVAVDRWDWLAPWFGDDWAASWLHGLGSDAEGLPARASLVSRHLELLRQLARTRGRYDLLRAELHFFADSRFEADALRSEAARLGDRWTALTLEQREQLRERWLVLLDSALALGRARDDLVRTHPVDRSPADKLYLSAYAESSFAHRHDEIAAVSREQRRTLS